LRSKFFWGSSLALVGLTASLLASILPALAFSQDMFEKTDASYGVNEVLLASVLGSVVFSMLAAQPLCIVGVTGPITVFNYTVYDILKPRWVVFFLYGLERLLMNDEGGHRILHLCAGFVSGP
jgi:MFS superfamily sulfate permease-like transporter